MALPKPYRLKHRQEFSKVYKSGLKRATAHLILRALPPSKGLVVALAAEEASVTVQPTRIGISVSQKVSKRAVVRNRIKRQIRSAMRQFLPQLLPGWQIVIIVKPDSTRCDYEEFLRELEQLLINAEVLNGYSGRSLL